MALKKKTQKKIPNKKQKPKKRKDMKQVAWNKGRRMQKTDRQHLYVRREDIQLWFAILLYCGGPVYAFAIWVALVSSRRISEALTLRRQSILLNGGSHDDKPHLLFEQEPTDTKKRGTGKLGSQYVAARLSEDAVCTLRAVERDGLKHQMKTCLEQYKNHPALANTKPLSTKTYSLPAGPKDRLFPAARVGQHDTLSRQAVRRLVETVVVLNALSNLDVFNLCLAVTNLGMESYEPCAKDHVPIDKASQVQSRFSWLTCAHSWHNSPHSCRTVAPQPFRVSVQETLQRYYSRDTEEGGHENF